MLYPSELELQMDVCGLPCECRTGLESPVSAAKALNHCPSFQTLFYICFICYLSLWTDLKVVTEPWNKKTKLEMFK